MTSISHYKDKSVSKKSNSSKVGLSQLVNFVHSGEQETNSTNNQSISSDQKVGTLTNADEAVIAKKFKEEFQAKEKALQNQLKNAERKLRDAQKEGSGSRNKSKLPVVIPTQTQSSREKINNEEIAVKTIYQLFTISKTLSKPELDTLLFIIKQTDYGKMKSVPIKREDFEKAGVQKSALSPALLGLEDKKIITFIKGRESETSYQATRFFTLTPGFLSTLPSPTPQ